MTTTYMRERIGRRDLAALAALVVAGVGIPLWLAVAAGAVGLPSNDDWVYIRAATTLFRTGTVDVAGHTTAFVGQLALVQPFLWLSGGDPGAFTAFGLVMESIGIVCTYLLARRFVGIGAAGMVVLLLVAFPGFARESASFMTDIPAYAFIVLCLLLGTRWLQGDGGPAILVASVVAGLVGVSIREFAVAAPIAVLLAAWARGRATERVGLAVLSIVLVAGVQGALAVAAAVSGHGPPVKFRFVGAIDLGPAFATLAAVLLPALLLHVGHRVRRFNPGVVIVGAAFACLFVFDPDGPILGNLWTARGLTGSQTLAGARDPLFGALPWAMSRQVALFAAILAAVVAFSWAEGHLARVTSVSTARAVAIRILRSPEGPLALFLAGYAAELVLYVLVGGGLFDRYLYPMVPVAAIVLLRGHILPFGTGRTQTFAHGAVAWLVISAFVIAANSFAYDTARFREGDAAATLGYDAQIVDAGYEWVGLHGSGAPKTFVPSGLNWWENIWPSFRPCAILSNSVVEIPGYRLIRANPSAYRQFLFFGPDEPLYLYGAFMEGCPPLPPAVSAG